MIDAMRDACERLRARRIVVDVDSSGEVSIQVWDRGRIRSDWTGPADVAREVLKKVLDQP